jgi:hypothetical protein
MDSALVDQASDQYLGPWKRLVSTTNWEKGRIIHQWREALRDAEAPLSEYADEAWSRRVGNVTPQHVGRLRRVFERFGAVHADYPGLYWSHFQSALDWDDAEMWLEGAVQNDWSISEMRHQRWETRGAIGEEAPDGLIEDTPFDDDSEPAEAAADVTTGTLGVVNVPEHAYTDGSEDDGEAERLDATAEERSVAHESASEAQRREAVRPFADLPPLPPDVNDAFEAYKLCILRHKVSGWQEISRDAMVFSLEALVELALAPAEA